MYSGESLVDKVDFYAQGAWDAQGGWDFQVTWVGPITWINKTAWETWDVVVRAIENESW